MGQNDFFSFSFRFLGRDSLQRGYALTVSSFARRRFEHFQCPAVLHIFGANLNRNFHFLGLSWPFPIDLQSGVMGPLTGGVRRWSSGLRRQDYYWKQQHQQENPTLLCFSQVPSRLRSSVPLDFGISVINGFFGVALCEVC